MGKEILKEYLEIDPVTGELTPRTLEIIKEVVKELREKGFGDVNNHEGVPNDSNDTSLSKNNK